MNENEQDFYNKLRNFISDLNFLDKKRILIKNIFENKASFIVLITKEDILNYELFDIELYINNDIIKKEFEKEDIIIEKLDEKREINKIEKEYYLNFSFINKG